MADGFRLNVYTDQLQRELKRIDKSVDRATMWAVREAGRKVKQEAMRNAPVYKGKEAVTRKAHAQGGSGNRPVRGLLRASIHSSKRLQREGNSFAVRVAPRGERVHLYSQKIEAKYRYMAKSHERVAPMLRDIAARAWERASRGRR